MKIENEAKLFELLKEKQKYLDDLIKTKDKTYKILISYSNKYTSHMYNHSLNISESIIEDIIEFVTIKIKNKLKEIDKEIELL